MLAIEMAARAKNNICSLRLIPETVFTLNRFTHLSGILNESRRASFLLSRSESTRWSNFSVSW